ncbi:MAG: DUF1297 domain-containing protein [Candidatus Aenigmatarchaeota archaeon]
MDVGVAAKSIGHEVLEQYDVKKLHIASICSSASLQIFQAARRFRFPSIGIIDSKDDGEWYDAFPGGKPDDFFRVQNYRDMLKADVQAELRGKNAYIIPHGTQQEALGLENMKVELPFHGYRDAMKWEINKKVQSTWLKDIAGLPMADIMEPKDMKGDKLYLIKRGGAKGGKGFFLVSGKEEYDTEIKARLADGRLEKDETDDIVVQEFLDGPRYYTHFFQDPLSKEGYKCGNGHLEMRGCDVRVETTADGRPRIIGMLTPKKQKQLGMEPSFTVTGNYEVVFRESLIKRALLQGRKVVDASKQIFDGGQEVVGPFCLECIVTDNLEIRPMEITGRLFGGTNAATGAWYAELADEGTYREQDGRPLSMAERVMFQIQEAISMKKLAGITS